MFLQELLKKSKENKEKNDKERFNYDKQYSSYFAVSGRVKGRAALCADCMKLEPCRPDDFASSRLQIEKGTSSWVPEDKATREKLGYTRCVVLA